jgi:hypothetical protein
MHKEPFLFRIISNHFEQRREFGQAGWLGGVVIGKGFDLGPKDSFSWFMPIEVFHEANASVPDVIRVYIDGYEDVK